MIECKTVEEALQVPDVIHIEAGDPVKAYQPGDALPEWCLSDEQRAAAESSDAILPMPQTS